MADGPMEVQIRPARREDVQAIARLLADDDLGKDRENIAEPLSQDYYKGFDDIAADSRSILAVAQTLDGEILGCLQVTFIPGLSHMGAERALIEDVRVDKRYRGRRIGRRLLEWAISQARQRHCCLVELFAHETRTAARRFYLELGFKDSHSGMRLRLT
jgi:GNAT superfamily N-acetyltransferase